MRKVSTPLRSLAAFLAVLALSAVVYAKGSSDATFPNANIKNFGQMDDRLDCGAGPKKFEDIQARKDLGINTVIGLKAEPNPSERGRVESPGMHHVNIPMAEKTCPRPEWVAAFMHAVDDPSTGKFFVHCGGGRRRTGSMGAVYRFEKYGWDYVQAYAEMKQFDFYTRWGHGDYKQFVGDYAQREQARGAKATTTAAAR